MHCTILMTHIYVVKFYIWWRRGTLLPDPRYDAARCIIMAVMDDDEVATDLAFSVRMLIFDDKCALQRNGLSGVQVRPGQLLAIDSHLTWHNICRDSLGMTSAIGNKNNASRAVVLMKLDLLQKHSLSEGTISFLCRAHSSRKYTCEEGNIHTD